MKVFNYYCQVDNRTISNFECQHYSQWNFTSHRLSISQIPHSHKQLHNPSIWRPLRFHRYPFPRAIIMTQATTNSCPHVNPSKLSSKNNGSNPYYATKQVTSISSLSLDILHFATSQAQNTISFCPPLEPIFPPFQCNSLVDTRIFVISGNSIPLLMELKVDGTSRRWDGSIWT